MNSALSIFKTNHYISLATAKDSVRKTSRRPQRKFGNYSHSSSDKFRSFRVINIKVTQLAISTLDLYAKSIFLSFSSTAVMPSKYFLLPPAIWLIGFCFIMKFPTCVFHNNRKKNNIKVCSASWNRYQSI